MLGKRVFDSNLSEVVLFADAVEMWQTDHLPNLPRSFDGSLDDHLHRDGQISDWQNHNWGVPPCLED